MILYLVFYWYFNVDVVKVNSGGFFASKATYHRRRHSCLHSMLMLVVMMMWLRLGRVQPRQMALRVLVV